MSIYKHSRELFNTHYINVRDLDIYGKMDQFDKDASSLSDTDRTIFAQICLRNFCSFRPNIDLAKFYLSKMDESHNILPACSIYEYPLLHELAHQVYGESSCSEEDLLLLLLEHPCYKSYFHKSYHSDKYAFTALDRYLVTKHRFLTKKDTPLRKKLKELYPTEYPILMEKAIIAGKSFDSFGNYEPSGIRRFSW